MIISHYLISWVQVAGLIATLYGFFYLSSMEVFGTKSIYIFRPLLPALATGLSFTIFTKFAEYVNNAPTLLALLWTRLPIPIVVVFIGSFLCGLMFAALIEELRTSKGEEVIWPLLYPMVKPICKPIYNIYKDHRREMIRTLLGIYLFSIVLSGTLVLLHWVPSSYFIAVVLQVPIYLLVIASLTLLIMSPRYLSKDRLINLGFFLSVFGILTSFLPAILDVTGITIH